MTPMPSFDPGPFDIEGWLGETLRLTFALVSDGAPFPLTGYDVEAFFKETTVTLTEGEGLEVDDIAGTVVLTLTPDQTRACQQSPGWWMSLTNQGSGDGGYVLRGSVTIADP